jgi:KipI family sensor histidine kinase inhibitor
VTEPSSTIAPLGDSALLVTFGDRIDPGLNERAHDLAAAVDGLRTADPRFGRAVPAYASVLVPFDPVAVDPDAARRVVAALLGESQPRPGPGTNGPGTLVEIPVRYGGDDGPDLADVAALNDLRPDDVVELHAGTEYRVYFLGFAPGFAYLGPVPAQIATPRLDAPRQRIPAGSVGIAGEQTGVYPFELPGGWRIIGRTDHSMWDLRRDSPALLRPGDRVRFVPSP